MSRRPKGNGLPRYPLPGDPNLGYHLEAYHSSRLLAMSVHRSPPPEFVGGHPLLETVQGLPPPPLGFVNGPPAPGFVVGSPPPPRVIYGPAPQGYSSLPYGPSRSVEHPSSDKYGEGTPRDLAETAPKYGRKESSGATRRPTESNRRSDKLPTGRELTVTTRRQPNSERHSDSEPESEKLTVARRGQTTVATRCHPNSERHSDRQAEREQLTVARRGQTTVATRRHPDSKRPSDKPVHSSKGRKSTDTADKKAFSTRIFVRLGMFQFQPEVDIDLGEGEFDVKYESDKESRNITWNKRGKKSTGRRSEVKAIEPSRDNGNTERSMTLAIEPSRGSRNTQLTMTRVPNYYAFLGCKIDDTPERIIEKIEKKNKELLSRLKGRRRMSKQEVEKIGDESDLLWEAYYVLEDENRRLDYDQSWLSEYGD